MVSIYYAKLTFLTYFTKNNRSYQFNVIILTVRSRIKTETWSAFDIQYTLLNLNDIYKVQTYIHCVVNMKYRKNFSTYKNGFNLSVHLSHNF